MKGDGESGGCGGRAWSLSLWLGAVWGGRPAASDPLTRHCARGSVRMMMQTHTYRRARYACTIGPCVIRRPARAYTAQEDGGGVSRSQGLCVQRAVPIASL